MAPLPRSQSIEKSWSNLDWPSVFAAVIYPSLGVIGLILAMVLGLALPAITFHWWYIVLAMMVGGITLMACNMGIGVLHRIWQHKAGELKWPAQIITALNCVLAMQGTLKDWVNYHSQHHRLSDKPGDPHNPAEGKLWAWMGWLFFRDRNDLKRPMAMWLRDIPFVKITDQHYNWLTLTIHLFVPAAIYLATWALGGSVILVLLLHSAAIIARGVQFHATILGINVFGHLKTPLWFDYVLALLTGGEAFHDHHHDYPVSALHLPRKGFFNRIFDYNGTLLLIFEKLKWAKDLKIAPQFISQPRLPAAE
ncbi:acyl-CoA desaturase [Woodsholea maritima]|uniref:acyl-CoA desaturase n=1 Tax=Woodsholea maritima TaxID=240237 RepID=UPI00037444A7|nr:acyl-CoA desaturase [Woodsholea maritima]